MTRRQFFASLVPCTRWLQVFVGLLAVAAASFLLATLIGGDQFLTLLKAGLAGTVIVLVLWLLAKAINFAGTASRKSPPFIQALVTVFLECLLVAVIAATTIRIYERWKNGESMAESYVIWGMLLIWRLIDTWKTRAGKDAQPGVPADWRK